MSDTTLLSLLRRYDKPGPRYTSYPTVPAWRNLVNAGEYARDLKSLQTGEELSLYFHLPFCENLCHFCGCTQVITKDHSRSASYVETLLREVKQVVALLPPELSVGQIHFGGGTPNFLHPDELSQIMQAIRDHFTVLNDAEIAIEMHPRTSTPAFCERLATLGFNRVSLGVQDLDPKVQKLINRNQTFEMTRDMVVTLRALGFSSFNFDLVYGLPGQSYAGWQQTLEQVQELKPNRLAVYSYAHVPWVRPVQRTFEDSDLPPAEMKIELFEKAYRFFLAHGYEPIGMDHFALKADELARALHEGTIHRNFMGYSTRADAHQIGFGMSAISYVAGNYYQNLKVLKEYDAAVRGGGLASFRGMETSREDAIRRDLITELMCKGAVSGEAFGRKWNLDFSRHFKTELEGLKAFEADGLLTSDGSNFKAIGYGHLFLRNMAMVFDQYLGDIQAKSKNPTFSRTV